MQVRYQPAADRVLWQVRTQTGELFAVWLTRRMLKQLWPPLSTLVTSAGLAQAAPNATVLPEAREMMAQVARARSLANANFNTPFDAKAVAQPLGPEPLLPTAIDLGPGTDAKGLRITVREPGGRHMTLQLSADLATALMRLLEQALAEADWGLGPTGAAPAPSGAGAEPPAPPSPPSLLN